MLNLKSRGEFRGWQMPEAAVALRRGDEKGAALGAAARAKFARKGGTMVYTTAPVGQLVDWLTG